VVNTDTTTSADIVSKAEMVDRARALAPEFRERAAAAEDARKISDQSAAEMLASGIARMLVPRRLGGSQLGLDAWFDVVLEIGRGDASHAWCASLMAHVPQMLLQYGDEVQQAIWGDGPDVPTAGSVMPFAKVVPVDGGYRVSGQAPFASGVDHSTWVFVGGFLPGDGPPDAAMFLVRPGDYEVLESWFTAGMRGTGSNTIVTDGAFVPEAYVLRIADLREGTGPGAALNPEGIYQLPFVCYAPLSFTAPMLGAAQGAYQDLLTWVKDKRMPGGARLAEAPTLQAAIGRTAADLDAAELLLRNIIATSADPDAASLEHRSACMRNASRASELIVDAIDRIVKLGSTSSFADSNPAQRAWRDIHFAAAHVSLQTEVNYPHWARTELGLEKPPALQVY
jgi:3-hydroxy-9,10-secoandrosta-1,3,5(10)-triene-9,17-dione monooxygenase